MTALSPAQRVFLMLQGPHGPFFDGVGRLLRDTGAQVWRVGFNAGDEFFWSDKACFIRSTKMPTLEIAATAMTSAASSSRSSPARQSRRVIRSDIRISDLAWAAAQAGNVEWERRCQCTEFGPGDCRGSRPAGAPC